jgi:Peptidase inhibitor I78 family
MNPFLLQLIALAGVTGSSPPANSTPPIFGAGRCNADATNPLVGKVSTGKVAARALKLSGAKVVRQLRPNMIVTQEYRRDRLNIHVDGKNRIIRIACG